MGDFVTIERQGRVAIITLNRPDSLNAVETPEHCADMVDAIATLEADRGVSVAILTGAGRAFCSGGNLKAIKARTGIGPLEQPDSTRTNYRRGVQAITRAFLSTELPMIAAVNGHAIGLGCDLACLCDVRLAGESAQFAASFVKVGIVPGDGGAWTLQQVLGYSLAAELFLTGDRFDAARARELGLVSRVVPDAELLPAAMELTGRIAANPPRALRMTKRLLREAQTQHWSTILEMSAAFQAIAHETADHREAVDAFLEKRSPTFTGD